MLAGHFTTALVAKQEAPKGHIAYYLVAAQLPDLLWLPFHYLGLEVTHPHNIMATSLDNLQVDMTYSHDLLPLLGWIALVIGVGRALFGSWRPGLIGGLLLVVHAATDYLGGFPHNLFGPETASVGTGLYHSSPYLAVVLEGVFIVAMLAWVLRNDAKAGIQRSRSTYLTWAAVFGGNMAFLLFSADLSMAEMFGLTPSPAMDGTTVPMMAATYLSMLAALIWAEGKPTRARAERESASSVPAAQGA